MIAMTTSSSISVNARRRARLCRMSVRIVSAFPARDAPGSMAACTTGPLQSIPRARIGQAAPGRAGVGAPVPAFAGGRLRCGSAGSGRATGTTGRLRRNRAGRGQEGARRLARGEGRVRFVREPRPQRSGWHAPGWTRHPSDSHTRRPIRRPAPIRGHVARRPRRPAAPARHLGNSAEFSVDASYPRIIACLRSQRACIGD